MLSIQRMPDQLLHNVLSLSIFSGFIIFTYFSEFSLSYVQIFLLLAIIVYIPTIIESYYKTSSYFTGIIAGISLFFSFQLSQGWLSAFFALPWFVFTILLAIILLSDLKILFRLPEGIEMWLKLSSVLFLPLAAGILVISRLGLQPFDFSHTIIELTAIHFHYTGFSIPLFSSFIIRSLPDKDLRLPGWLLVIGTPLVATGITMGQYFPIAGLLAVVIFVTALVYLCFLVLIYHHKFSRLITTAHLVMIPSMLLALYYAIGVAFEIRTISISEMVISHGIINGAVYLPLNIVGWHRTLDNKM